MDHDLVRRAREGDRSAFEALVVADGARLYRLAQGILRDPHLAEDATQQAYVDIWRGLGRLRDPSRFEGWSYRVLLRICYAEAKRRRTIELPPDGAAWEPVGRDPTLSVDDRDRLERGFARLSAEHRAVVAMRFLLDLSPDEIAEALGIQRRTVYSRLKRGTAALRAALEADARPTIRLAAGRPETIR